MRVECERFGELPTTETVTAYTLRNSRGAAARIIDYGATLLSLQMPDRDGVYADIVLGMDSLAGYLNNNAYLGATVGRVAGRIRNGTFAIGGRDYDVGCNAGAYCLHGGDAGFSRRLWHRCTDIDMTGDEASVQLALFDATEHSGFPGNLSCRVTYTLSNDNILIISYGASSTADTPFNPTHHSYFNLAGGGDVLAHEVQLSCAEIAVHDAAGVSRQAVQPGYNDYRSPTALSSRRVLDVGNADFYGFLDGGRAAQPRFAARVRDPSSGRVMEVFTTDPGIVFYAGLSLGKEYRLSGKAGQTYSRYSGLCLEPQDFADSINYPMLGNAILRAGDLFQSTTEYRFSHE